MMDARANLKEILQRLTSISQNELNSVLNSAQNHGALSAGTHTSPNGTVYGLAPEGAIIWELSEAEGEGLAGTVHWPYSTYERALAGADEHAGRFAEGAGQWQRHGLGFAFENHPAEYRREVPGIGWQYLRPRFLDS